MRVILSFILILCFVSSVYAAPCYGTRMPEKKDFFLGFQSHTIFKRYLKDNYGKLRSMQEFMLLSYGVTDWLAIDLKGGVGNIKQHPLTSDEIDYPSYLGGGYGFRLKLYEKEKIRAVFGFQHISIHPKTISVENVKHKAVLDDWQFSLLGSYEISKFTPYIGTRWSKVDYILWRDGNRKREKSESGKSVGLILGTDVNITKNLWFNLEGSFFDSEAAAFSVNFKL